MMAITYNPYGWEIRPRKTEHQETVEKKSSPGKTELQETIKKEREIARLEEKITCLMNEANSRINQFISHNQDPITLLIELDKMFPEIQKLVEEIARLNFELYGFRAYPIIP